MKGIQVNGALLQLCAEPMPHSVTVLGNTAKEPQRIASSATPAFYGWVQTTVYRHGIDADSALNPRQIPHR